MTDQEIRIEIAECCGWKWVGMHGSKKHGYWYLNLKQENVPIAESGKFGGATPSYSLPNYPQDLNAMHEAEKIFNTDNSGMQFYRELEDIVQSWMVNSKNTYGYLTYWTIHATAQQRAEAFLRTVGKWKD